MKLPSIRFLLAAGLLSCLTACFDPQEGCLDAAAVNFDATADDDCCCEYPNLVVEFRQSFGAPPYNPSAVYSIGGGKPFFLRGAAFYFSDFQLSRGTDTFQVLDTITLRAFTTNGQGTERILQRDDATLVRALGDINNDAGTFLENGVFDGVRFRIGLGEPARRTVASLVATGHPLGSQTDSLWDWDLRRYTFARLVVQRDTAGGSTGATDTLDLGQNDLGDLFLTRANAAYTKRTGYDLRLILELDYEQLLKGVDWTKGDKNTWKAQIAQNMQGAFRVQ